MRRKDLLIEIGTEELPPKALKQLAEAFAGEIHNGLEKNALSHAAWQWYATPRRLAVIVEKLVARQQDHEVLKRGPALAAAFDATGKPTRAAEGFARSCNVDVSDLEQLETDKGAWLAYRSIEAGQETTALLQEIIETALAGLPIPKRMRWADHDAEFVRPVHWGLVLFGRQIVPCTIMGISSGNVTYGHRFHHPKAIRIHTAGEYLAKLQDKGRVIADFTQRRQLIEKIAGDAAQECGGMALSNAALLDEITSLVEWPVAVTGSFEEKFLQLPKEVLIATMQDHQKYFPVADSKNERLLNRFITIANIDSKSPDEVRKGNERVIRPRLADAAFFWRRDTGQSLEDFVSRLHEVIFQKQLGTFADKTQRVKKLAVYIAEQLNEDPQSVARAATLARCDLFTEMVGEFPELQGIMGYYYALESGETEEVARALEEQYRPRFAKDALPETATGKILSIADKLDTLLGIFAIGRQPTGDKDPFALRRAALGCLRVLIECRMELDLNTCLENAAGNFAQHINAAGSINEVFDFMVERLRRYYLDAGITVDVFEAVLAVRPGAPYDFHQRIHAVTEFRKLPEAESLAVANKRIQNILRQAGTAVSTEITPNLLREKEERDLVESLDRVSSIVEPMMQRKDYAGTLRALAGLRQPVDAFFDRVMVMTEEDSLRNNRLAVLNRISTLFLAAADISCLQG